VRDFCRVTGTRLPDAALGREDRGDWLQVSHMAPPMRDPTPAEITAVETILRNRHQARRQKEEKRARFGVVRCSGPRPRSVLRERGPGGISGPAQSSASPSIRGEAIGIVPADKAAQAATVTQAELRRWYIQRVASWPSSEVPPSEKRDNADAKEAFPGLSVSREWLRVLRREHAPRSWKEPGPKKSRGQ
jgi:hypothetical protein